MTVEESVAEVRSVRTVEGPRLHAGQPFAEPAHDPHKQTALDHLHEERDDGPHDAADRQHREQHDGEHNQRLQQCPECDVVEEHLRADRDAERKDADHDRVDHDHPDIA